MAATAPRWSANTSPHGSCIDRRDYIVQRPPNAGFPCSTRLVARETDNARDTASPRKRLAIAVIANRRTRAKDLNTNGPEDGREEIVQTFHQPSPRPCAQAGLLRWRLDASARPRNRPQRIDLSARHSDAYGARLHADGARHHARARRHCHRRGCPVALARAASRRRASCPKIHNGGPGPASS